MAIVKMIPEEEVSLVMGEMKAFEGGTCRLYVWR